MTTGRLCVVSQAIPAYAQALSGAAQAAVQIPFQDTAANAAHQLAGQVSREGEAINWAQLLSGVRNAQQGYNTTIGTSLAGLIG